jgi:ABC-type nitrate/sulfonate/bicarbonate transport system substrate-binding protein
MYWFLVMHRDFGARRGELDVVKGRRIGAAPWVEKGLRRLLIAAGLDLMRDHVAIAPVPGAHGAGVNFGVTAAKALEQRTIDGFWANGMGAEVAVRRGVGTVFMSNLPPCLGSTLLLIQEVRNKRASRFCLC